MPGRLSTTNKPFSPADYDLADSDGHASHGYGSAGRVSSASYTTAASSSTSASAAPTYALAAAACHQARPQHEAEYDLAVQQPASSRLPEYELAAGEGGTQDAAPPRDVAPKAALPADSERTVALRQAEFVLATTHKERQPPSPSARARGTAPAEYERAAAPTAVGHYANYSLAFRGEAPDRSAAAAQYALADAPPSEQRPQYTLVDGAADSRTSTLNLSVQYDRMDTADYELACGDRLPLGGGTEA